MNETQELLSNKISATDRGETILLFERLYIMSSVIFKVESYLYLFTFKYYANFFPVSYT